MAADQNLGQWDARPGEPFLEPSGGQDRPEMWSPEPDPSGPEGPRRAGGSSTGGRGSTFWLGVMVGLVPLVAVIAGFVGFRLAGGDDGATDAEVSLDTSAGAGTDAGTPSSAEGSGDDALTVETAPASPSSTSGAIAAEPLLATGTVDGERIELGGELPSTIRAQWTSEFGILAAALGRELVDGTEEGFDPDGTASAAMIVGFPGAVIFQERSPSFFEGDPNPVFAAVAEVLNLGTAQLTIIGYADASDPEASVLAVSRAEHVYEHLLDLGVDPVRLTVEARSLGEAPVGVGEQGPIDRRSDLEFHYAS